jgi:hypothetical protein
MQEPKASAAEFINQLFTHFRTVYLIYMPVASSISLSLTDDRMLNNGLGDGIGGGVRIHDDCLADEYAYHVQLLKSNHIPCSASHQCQSLRGLCHLQSTLLSKSKRSRYRSIFTRQPDGLGPRSTLRAIFVITPAGRVDGRYQDQCAKERDANFFLQMQRKRKQALEVRIKWVESS